MYTNSMNDWRSTKDYITELKYQLQRLENANNIITLQYANIEAKKERSWLKYKQLKYQNKIDDLKTLSHQKIIKIQLLIATIQDETLRLQDIENFANPMIQLPDVKY